MFDYTRLRNDLLALVVLAGTVYLGLCLASYDPADRPAGVLQILPDVAHRRAAVVEPDLVVVVEHAGPEQHAAVPGAWLAERQASREALARAGLERLISRWRHSGYLR